MRGIRNQQCCREILRQRQRKSKRQRLPHLLWRETLLESWQFPNRESITTKGMTNKKVQSQRLQDQWSHCNDLTPCQKQVCAFLHGYWSLHLLITSCFHCLRQQNDLITPMTAPRYFFHVAVVHKVRGARTEHTDERKRSWHRLTTKSSPLPDAKWVFDPTWNEGAWVCLELRPWWWW
jgi:hypothetical protein